MGSHLKIFVSGGQGYLGGRLSKFLADKGHEVLIGTRKLENSQKPIWLTEGQLVSYSTEDSVADLAEKLQGVNVIIHTAAPNDAQSSRDPENCIMSNSIGTYRLCEAAQKLQVETFVYFSTAHVYGSPLIGSYSELSVPHPNRPYAYAHLAAEHIVLSAMSSDGNGIPNPVVIRLSNSFGAPVSPAANCWNLLVNDLCRQAILDGTLTLKSDGQDLRDFIPISDVERAVEHVIFSRLGANCFNLAGGQSITILEMAKKIAKIASDFLGKEVPLKIAPCQHAARDPSTDRLEIGISKIRNTGFEQKNDLDNEIRETLTFCEKAFSKKSL